MRLLFLIPSLIGSLNNRKSMLTNRQVDFMGWTKSLDRWIRCATYLWDGTVRLHCVYWSDWLLTPYSFYVHRNRSSWYFLSSNNFHRMNSSRQNTLQNLYIETKNDSWFSWSSLILHHEPYANQKSIYDCPLRYTLWTYCT